MRILVIGRHGQLARALTARHGGKAEIVTLARPDIDLADPAGLAGPILAARPDAIVNAAAYTAVDRAESEEALANLVNGTAPGIMADVAARLGVPFVHVSTDYVFPGDGLRPYRETDAIGPRNAYGRSKAAGEAAVAASGADHALLRTAWVYSANGANFLRTMLRLAADRDEVRVVCDQHGSPTFAGDLAGGILAMLERWPRGLRRTYHATAGGNATWASFAEAIFAEAETYGLPSAKVVPITTDQYPTPAHRPAMSVLDCARLETDFDIVLPHWRDTLAALFADPAFRTALAQ